MGGGGGEVKHLVLAKFKEEVVAEDIIKGMQDLVTDVDLVLSFEWGQDMASPDMLRQGFTHAFLMTFRTQEDLASFQAHPKHVEFSATFSTAIEKIVLLDFPSVLVKPDKAAATTDEIEDKAAGLKISTDGAAETQAAA